MTGRAIRLIVAVLAVVPLALAQGGEKRFEKKFAVSPGGTLRIATDVGSIKITGTGSNEVSVVAQLRGRDRDVEAFDITAEETKGGVEVRGKGRTKRGWFWNSVELTVDYTIQVPHEYSLDIHTSGGDVEVNSLKGEMRGGTSGGNIVLGAVEGKVTMETSGGDIRVEKAAGDMKLETSGGNITIGNVEGAVDVETSGGDIRLGEVRGRVHAETSGGNVRVKVTGANEGIHAETSGGNIEVMIGKNVGAELDAATSGGEVECEIPVTVKGKISESRIRGTVNGGGKMIYAHTSGGNVRIKAIP
jgi:DUF4097 and DUF4098 domain-containing protein YvlB